MTFHYYQPTRYVSSPISWIMINNWERLQCCDDLIDSLLFQVFVLMQFDPGLEYKPPSVRRATNSNTQSTGVGGGGSNKDDNSWLLLCSALTDGPYSYIWTTEKFSICNAMQFINTFIRNIIGKIYLILTGCGVRNQEHDTHQVYHF